MEIHGLTHGVKRIDHVAIVVRKLEAALRFYRDTLGIAPSRVLDFPREGVKIAFLPLGGPGGSEIELLEPTDPAGGVARFLEKRGEGLHHICVEAESLEQFEETLSAAAEHGASVVQQGVMPGGLSFAYLAAPQAGVPFVEVAHFSAEMRQFFDYIKQEQH